MKEYFYNKDGIVVRRTIKSDIDYLKDNLKESNVKEIWYSGNLLPEEALEMCREHALSCLTVCNGNPILIFGVYANSLTGDEATIFMLSSDDIKKIQRRFLRNCRKFIDYFLEFYPVLSNAFVAEDEETFKWLSFLKAEIELPAPFGVEGKMFRKFKFVKNKE